MLGTTLRITNYLAQSRREAVSPAICGTKVAANYLLTVGPGETRTVRLRSTTVSPDASTVPLRTFAETLSKRLEEADEFCNDTTSPAIRENKERAGIMRQALAGMLKLPRFARKPKEFLTRHPELASNLHMPAPPGVAGIRALSRYHLDHPFVFQHGGRAYRVSYLPGDGDSFTIECPTGSGTQVTLFQVAHELAERLIGTFERNGAGRRPVYGETEKFQSDPYWKDCILFYEYFHGDNGAGIGASHQIGWTGAIARLIQVNGSLTEAMFSEAGVETEAVRTTLAANATPVDPGT